MAASTGGSSGTGALIQELEDEDDKKNNPFGLNQLSNINRNADNANGGSNTGNVGGASSTSRINGSGGMGNLAAAFGGSRTNGANGNVGGNANGVVSVSKASTTQSMLTDTTDTPPKIYTDDELIQASFLMIDADGGGTLSREEFQVWFEKSDLVGLMSFSEFYKPIARIDVDRSGQTDVNEYVMAMKQFKKFSDIHAVCLNSLTFYLAVVFILAGALMVVNEMLLGEGVHEEEDLSWRIMETGVWGGFVLGMFGYLRTYLVSIDRECNDNKDQINMFRESIIAHKIGQTNEEGIVLEDGFDYDQKDVIVEVLDPLDFVEFIVRIIFGTIWVVFKMVELIFLVLASIIDNTLALCGFNQHYLSKAVMKISLSLFLIEQKCQRWFHEHFRKKAAEKLGIDVIATGRNGIENKMQGKISTGDGKEFMVTHKEDRNGKVDMKIVPVDPTSSREISVLGGTGSKGLFRSLSGSVSGVGLRLKSFSKPLRQLSSKAKRSDLTQDERDSIEREQFELEEEERRQMAMAHEIFMREKKKRDEMNASHLGQFLDKEVEQLWIAGGMAAIKEYPDFWREYCFERTRYYDINGTKAPPDCSISTIEKYARRADRKRRTDALGMSQKWLGKKTKKLRNKSSTTCLSIPGASGCLTFTGLKKQGQKELEEEEKGRKRAQGREIIVASLLEAVTVLKYDLTTVKRLAKTRPGYWLTLMGLLAMTGRFIYASYYLISEEPMEPTGKYIVVCAAAKLLGDIGALLVFLQVINAELKLWAKIRELLLTAVLEEAEDKRDNRGLDSAGHSQAGRSSTKDSGEGIGLLKGLKISKARKETLAKRMKTEGIDIESPRGGSKGSNPGQGQNGLNPNGLKPGMNDGFAPPMHLPGQVQNEGYHRGSRRGSDVSSSSSSLMGSSMGSSSIGSSSLMSMVSSSIEIRRSVNNYPTDGVAIEIEMIEMDGMEQNYKQRIQNEQSIEKQETIERQEIYPRVFGNSISFVQRTRRESSVRVSSTSPALHTHQSTEDILLSFDPDLNTDTNSSSQNKVLVEGEHQVVHNPMRIMYRSTSGDSSPNNGSTTLGSSSLNNLFQRTNSGPVSPTSNSSGMKRGSLDENDALDLLKKKKKRSESLRSVDGRPIPIWIDDMMLFWLERQRKKFAKEQRMKEKGLSKHSIDTEEDEDYIANRFNPDGSPKIVDGEGFTSSLVNYARGYRGQRQLDMGVAIHDRNVEKQEVLEAASSAKRVQLADHAEAIFQALDEDGSGKVTKDEILSFIEKMGPSKGEMADEVELVFAKYDDNGEGTLELPELKMLLADLDETGRNGGEGTLELPELKMLLADLDETASPGAARKKLSKSPTFLAGVLVVIAGAFSLASAFVVALMGGERNYTADNGVLPFETGRTFWKFLDYPKAMFLLVRAIVLFATQMRFFKADAARYDAIYEALSRDGHAYLVEKENAAKGTKSMGKASFRRGASAMMASKKFAKGGGSALPSGL